MAAKEEEAADDPPVEFLCALSRRVMSDPVRCCGDGCVYERGDVEAWLKTSPTSPTTHQPLATKELRPEEELRRRIRS